MVVEVFRKDGYLSVPFTAKAIYSDGSKTVEKKVSGMYADVSYTHTAVKVKKEYRHRQKEHDDYQPPSKRQHTD